MTKHAVKSYKIWKDPNKKTGHKIGEIAVEMLIIVFAVTLSLALERWREHAAEKKTETEFLEGLRKDVVNDIAELKTDSVRYGTLNRAYTYFAATQPYVRDSVFQYIELLYNTTEFIPNISRYEALKSSGKLEVISDKELLDDIVSLYQENIVQLKANTAAFTNFKRTQLIPYLDDHMKPDLSNLEAVLHTDAGMNYLNKRFGVRSIQASYHDAIVLSQKIVREIDESLGGHHE